jgi:hypothetical protein
MPPMQAGPPPAGGNQAKTMFGYMAPQVPRPGAPAQPAPATAQPQPQPQAQRPNPPTPGGYPQQGFAPQQPAPQYPPQQPQGFAPGQPAYPPPAQPGYPQQQPHSQPLSQPLAQPQGYGQPQAGYPHQQLQAQPGYGQAPQQPQPQPQPQSPYSAQAQPGYGQPQGGYPQAQPPAQYNPMAATMAAPGPGQGQAPGYPQQPGFGQPQQPYPMSQAQPQPQYPVAGPGFGQQAGYPQAPNAYAQPDHHHGGGLNDLAARMPQSAPGTLFGFQISMLRDATVQKKILFLSGVALLVAIVVPWHLSPTVFSWSLPEKFKSMIWPIIAGGAYLLVAAAPPNVRQQVPPVVLQWIPFGVSFASLFLGIGGGGGAGGAGAFLWGDTIYMLGYALVVFGLLARIAQPQDQIARIVIAVGGGLLAVRWIDMLDYSFHFSGLPFLLIIYVLLAFVVTTLGVLCILFVVPPQKLPPALQTIDAFGPLVCAILLAWLPASVVLMGLVGLVHMHAGISVILEMAHLLLPIVAYFLVLMMASPAAYEEAKAMIAGKGAGGPPPPQGGGGYPPQGGGYPPQGGGYPPQSGGYPPQGGGYPPQQGGWQ